MIKFRLNPVSEMKGFCTLRMNDTNDKKGHGKSNIKFVYSQLQYVTVTCNILQNAANINNTVFITRCVPCMESQIIWWIFLWYLMKVKDCSKTVYSNLDRRRIKTFIYKKYFFFIIIINLYTPLFSNVFN